MRQIILDTETTGLDASLGHRIIEVAAVELCDRRLTGNRFHRYINPERAIDPGAVEIHGLTEDFLKDKPRFAEIAQEFLEFVRGAELIIHNAPFDTGFLNRELGLAGLQGLGDCCSGVTDTLRMARELHPGKKNNLNALCDRYEVDNSGRTLHGALLDAELLAEVYLSMTRGQNSLVIEAPMAAVTPAQYAATGSLKLVVLTADAEEAAAHEAYLAALDKASGGPCVWRRLEQAPV